MKKIIPAAEPSILAAMTFTTADDPDTIVLKLRHSTPVIGTVYDALLRHEFQSGKVIALKLLPADTPLPEVKRFPAQYVMRGLKPLVAKGLVHVRVSEKPQTRHGRAPLQFKQAKQPLVIAESWPYAYVRIDKKLKNGLTRKQAAAANGLRAPQQRSLSRELTLSRTAIERSWNSVAKSLEQAQAVTADEFARLDELVQQRQRNAIDAESVQKKLADFQRQIATLLPSPPGDEALSDESSNNYLHP